MHTENAMKAVYTILMVVMGFVILVPVLALMFGSFWSASPVASGHVTLDNWIRALNISIPADIPTLVFNSLVFAFATAAISVVLGVTMAFLVARTDMPYGHVFAKLGIVPRAFPVIFAALAWILLLSPRIGVLNVMFREAFGTNLFNIYSFPGMIFIMVLYESPIVFLIALNAFRLMDPSLEEQSIACGNTVMGTLRRVTLPVLRPLILSSFLLVFVIGLITLEVPILIGAPGGIFVFTSAIFNIIASEYQSLIYYNTAAALAMMVIPLSLISLFLYRHLVRRAESFVTVTGKARAEKRPPPGPMALRGLRVQFVVLRGSHRASGADNRVAVLLPVRGLPQPARADATHPQPLERGPGRPGILARPSQYPDPVFRRRYCHGHHRPGGRLSAGA